MRLNQPNYFNLYSKINHEHSDYSLTNHNHDDLYSSVEHNHDVEYSKKTHGHTNLNLETLILMGKEICVGTLKSAHDDDYSYYKIGNLMICYGHEYFSSVTPNSTMSKKVVFPVPFKYTPFVSITINSGSPQNVSVGYNNLNSKEFILNFHRTTSVNTRIVWFAIGSC